MRTALCGIVFAVVVAACSDSLIDPGSTPAASYLESIAAIRMDADTYVLVPDQEGWNARLGFTFTNRTGRSIFYLSCAGLNVTLEKKHGDKWRSVWAPVLPACGTLNEIAPGASITETFDFLSGFPHKDVLPKAFTADINGVYRLVWWEIITESYVGTPGNGVVPRSQRTSAPFRFVTTERAGIM